MQQLKEVEHKEATEKKKDRRSGKGRVLALSRRIYRLLLLQTENDVFYVESESTDGIYYYVKYNPDVKIEFCSCKDNSTRHVTCKHLHAVTFAIRMGTVKDTDKLPAAAEAKKYPHETLVTTPTKKKSFREDQYDF